MPAQVREAVASGLAQCAGNPSSPHAEGQAARRLLEEARAEIASFAAARPSEVIFTSGGTESNNTAIHGIVAGMARRDPRAARRIITSSVEHPSVLEACEKLRRSGVAVDLLPVDGRGLIDPDDLLDRIRGGRADLISILHVNNETGVMQPVAEMARIASDAGIPFHSDVVQSAGWLGLAETAREIPALSLAAHKLGGPPGIGALIVREGIPFEAFMAGGAQEGRKRAGTEPAALAAGFARAVALRREDKGAPARVAALRDRMEASLRGLEGGCRIHGSGAPRAANTSNVHLPSAPASFLVIRMDLLGFAVSTGSACSTGSARPSHVLRAMGCSEEEARESLRISLGPESKAEEVDQFVRALSGSLDKVRVPWGEILSEAEVA